MEYSCRQCGSLVEEGRPFCPHCRAPQIHVRTAEPVAIAHANSTSGTFSSDTFESLPLNRDTTTLPSFDRKVVVRAAIKAGLLGVLLGFLPLLNFVVAGALAVYFYRREGYTVVPLGLASRIGGAAGVVVIAVQTFLSGLWIFAFHHQKESIDSTVQTLHAIGIEASGADIQAGLQKLFTPSGLVAFLILFLFFMVISAALASIGGALASVTFNSRKPRP